MTAEKLDTLLLEYEPMKLEKAQIERIMTEWKDTIRQYPAAGSGELLALYREQLRTLDRKTAAIEKLITSCRDDRLRSILHARYLDGMTWEDVAAQARYSTQQIFRLKRAALRLLLKG